ncbi:MAG: class I SAM-dependent methyltransferase [Bacteroidota bacterium]
MDALRKVTKLFRDPLGVLKRRWTSLSERIRFGAPLDYRAVDYWSTRHGKYGFDLRGVGDKTKSHKENINLLEEGSRVFLRVCREANVPFSNMQVLDVGCGTGHFAEILRNNGVRDYLGIDIVDTLFEGLRAKLPGFRFQQIDIGTQFLDGKYDLILAMDVLQHVVNDQKFAFALENVRSHLNAHGIIIISTALGPLRRETFYVVRRPLRMFQNAFPGFTLSEPKPYADSFVFSLRQIR